MSSDTSCSFRSGPDSCFPPGTDVDYASSRTVSDGLTLMGLDTVALGKRAFINVSRNMLVKDLVMTLPKNRVVVELLESIEPDDEVRGGVPAAEAGGVSDRVGRFRRAAQ